MKTICENCLWFWFFPDQEKYPGHTCFNETSSFYHLKREPNKRCLDFMDKTDLLKLSIFDSPDNETEKMKKRREELEEIRAEHEADTYAWKEFVRSNRMRKARESYGRKTEHEER